MSPTYAMIDDVLGQIEIPRDGTLSRTVHHDEQLKVVLFAFAAGQELSEHTASTAAILHFLAGEAELTLGPDRKVVGAGAWIHMPPHLPHSVRARTDVVMLLTLLKGNGR